ncbi:hypothetical protein SCUP515_01449 [Seiridium cupressi]
MLRNITLAALAGVASATTFNGTGQLRTLSSLTADRGTDLGCLTNAGNWTTEDSLCGTFTGTRSGSVYTTLTSLDGPCTIDDSKFTCGTDLTALQFWAWTGLLDNYDVLAHSEQITYSSSSNISEVSDSSVPIRTYRTTDPKPWVWLGWSAI